MQPPPDTRDAIEAARRLLSDLPASSSEPAPAWPTATDRDPRASTPERPPSNPARHSGRPRAQVAAYPLSPPWRAAVSL